MVRLDLADTLTLTPRAEGVTLEVTGEHATGVPTDASNLAYRAAELYLQAANISKGIGLMLEKHIPVAAGLGGGSADAAAVLHGLAELYPAGLDLFPLATQLGSDVGFFVFDVTAARAQGRGEVLEHLFVSKLNLVLVNPGVAVSAKDAYGYLQRTSDGLDVSGITACLHDGREPSIHNDLEAGVTSYHPAIAEVLAALKKADLRGVSMSGSGSTCFGIANDPEHAQRVADELAEAHAGWWVRAAKGE
jgi:4-diphosphocytidyl-2-C-methyl-D-erythritol kinase